MTLFGVFQSFMMSHMEKRCQRNEENGSECKLLRMKMNLYPNEGKRQNTVYTMIYLATADQTQM